MVHFYAWRFEKEPAGPGPQPQGRYHRKFEVTRHAAFSF